MSKELIPLKPYDGEIRVDSRVLSEQLNVTHRFTVRLINKYENQFLSLGVLRFQNAIPKKKSKGGKPEKFALLNEAQAIFLLTLSKNSKEVVSCKLNLTTAFNKYKTAYIRQAANRGELAWQQARKGGKLIRHDETDEIKAFAEYATGQGSQNATRYYSNISKMVNKSLFFVEKALPKPNNFRDTLDRIQLNHLSTADSIVANASRRA